MKTTIGNDKKGFNELDKKNLEFPSCYGNFNNMSGICQNCKIKALCKKIPPPRNSEWCCNPP
ncbi:MAG: hypothetical protein ACFFC3_10225 [Candidatus Odinarchaeota archaeon]